MTSSTDKARDAMELYKNGCNDVQCAGNSHKDCENKALKEIEALIDKAEKEGYKKGYIDRGVETINAEQQGVRTVITGLEEASK